MHILIVSPYLVGGYSLGGAKRIFRMLRYFAGSHKISYASFDNTQGRNYLYRSEIQDFCRAVVTVPLQKPGPLRKGVNFLLRPLPASFYYHQSAELKMKVRALVEKEKPDFIHVEFFEMASAVSGLPRAIPRALVSQEILSLARRYSNRPFDIAKACVQIPKIRAYEKKISRIFDRVYCITEQEREYLETLGVRNSAVYPHVVDTSEFSPLGPEKQRDGALFFLGNFEHKPNRDALHWFITKVFPLVRKEYPPAVLHVVGPNLDKAYLGDCDMRNIEFHGEVGDLQQFYEGAAVFVNPIVSGGGTRGKVLEAMSKCRAVVSTKLGVQGIDVRHGEEVLLAETAPDFASETVALLRHPQRRHALASKARARISGMYDERMVFERLLTDYMDLAGQKE